MKFKQVRHLLWCDLETSSLPKKNDYSGVHILEVGVILTDMSLNKLGGYSEVIKMTDEAADSLRKTPGVLEMHKSSGLLKDCVNATMTVPDVESEILALLDDNNVEVQAVALAGSGVTAFDHPVIKEHMPLLAEALTYFSYDIGSFRRMFKLVSGGTPIVNPSNHSYGPTKKHRAMEDIKAHLEEAEEYMEAVKKLLPPF